MRNIIFILFAILATACSQPNTKTSIRFELRDYTGDNPRIIYGWQNRSVAIDSATGIGIMEFDLQSPIYVTVEVRKHERKLYYLEPGENLTLAYSMKKGEKDITYGGGLAQEAQFLNQTKLYSGVRINFRNTDIQRIVRQMDSIIDLNQNKLKETNLSPTFKNIENKRIQTDAWMILLRSQFSDTTQYLETLKTTIQEDSSYLVIPAYEELLEQYVRRLVSLQKSKGRILEGTDLADARLDCIFKTFHHPAIIGYLIDKTLFHLGDSGIEKYEQIYKQYVKDPERLALYSEACKKADRIAPGQPCPDFSFQNNQGKTISLADLKGKFVYIDMWATWCGPCKGEMPSLLKLEEEFAGQDILFVSLSVDRNKDIELWKKTIKEMGLGGIQLHLGENWEWLKIFMPASISVPRFVLLDREGKIINANMSRPSDKATAEKFRELLNQKK